jgi:hypothetical protein
MPVCEVCGASFEPDGYHVAADGRLFDSMECALRAATVRRPRGDATTEWVAAARRRLGIVEPSTNVESKPADH